MLRVGLKPVFNTFTVYLCIAYGVSPSLKVGFEEALFLASKIKNSLGGSLSTEKVFYLLFITLQRKHKSVTAMRGRKQKQSKQNFSGGCREERTDEVDEYNADDTEFERDIRTFRAFIIRYLYFLREQRIVNQVYKMGSI